MRVCQVFTLFLVLWDGRPDLTRAETFSAAEGETFTGKLLFYSSGNWKIFCKNDCNKTENILVKTSENRQKNGRYSIEYKDSSNPRTMSVSITNVSRSDSGRYSCGLGNWSGAVQIDKDYIEFMLEVTKVSFRPTVPPSYNVTTTQQSVTSALTSSTLQVLWDGRPDLTRAETFSAAEGETSTVKLQFFFTGNWKIFCKNDCNKTENILVKTSENRQKNGRYSIEYEEDFSDSFLSVSITNVSRSDSGRYSCGLENWSGEKLIDKEYKDFMIKVTKGAASKNPVSSRPTVPPSYNVTTTQQSVTSALTSSTLQVFKSGDRRPDLSAETPVYSTVGEENFTIRTLLYVGLTVAAAVILLLMTLFILCKKKRANKQKELAEASDNAQIPESNCLYEEIPDKISQSSPRPVEISTVYVSASFSNTMEQTSDIYSLASEPSAQLQPEDILSNVTYSELDFTKSSDVVVHTAQTEAAPSPLYSTVASAQQ